MLVRANLNDGLQELDGHYLYYLKYISFKVILRNYAWLTEIDFLEILPTNLKVSKKLSSKPFLDLALKLSDDFLTSSRGRRPPPPLHPYLLRQWPWPWVRVIAAFCFDCNLFSSVCRRRRRHVSHFGLRWKSRNNGGRLGHVTDNDLSGFEVYERVILLYIIPPKCLLDGRVGNGWLIREYAV